MSGSTVFPTTTVISDPETLARTLREIVQLLEQSPRSSLPQNDPLRRLLSQVEARAVWLLLNLCSAQLAQRDWVSLHSLSVMLRRELSRPPGG